MRAGLLRRGDHLRRVGLRPHAADVLGDGAVEEHHVLRQVADVAAEHVRVVVLRAPRRRAAPRRRPGARCRSARGRASTCPRPRGRSRRAPGRARCWKSSSRRLAFCCSGGTTVSWLTSTLARGRGRAVGAACSGVFSSSVLRFAQPWPGAQHQRPAADRLLDRRQRPAEQDRAGDHRAGAHLALEHHVGAEAEHRRLQEEAEGLGHRRELADPVARGELRVERARPRSRCQRSSTAPCMPSAWTISPCWRTVSAKASPCIVAAFASASGRLVRIWFRSVAHDQQQHAGDREVPEQRMEAVDREEEDRRPGHVEDGEEHRRAGEPLHRLEVLEARGRASSARSPAPPGAASALEHPGVEPACTVAPIRAATRPRT